MEWNRKDSTARCFRPAWCKRHRRKTRLSVLVLGDVRTKMEVHSQKSSFMFQDHFLHARSQVISVAPLVKSCGQSCWSQGSGASPPAASSVSSFPLYLETNSPALNLSALMGAEAPNGYCCIQWTYQGHLSSHWRKSLSKEVMQDMLLQG